MSHFIIGTISVSSEEIRSRAGRQAVQIGVANGLTVRLLDEASGKLQREILHSAAFSVGRLDVVFDLVGPSGTADELISPYVLVDQWPDRLKPTLLALSSFARRSLEDMAISQIALVFSEGYDTDYKRFEVAVDGLSDFLLGELARAGEVPSLAVVVKR